jgi:excisionase family DNA binding protein
MIPTLEAAERLGIDVLDVYRMIDEGRLPAAWDGHRQVVPVSQVDALAGFTP